MIPLWSYEALRTMGHGDTYPCACCVSATLPPPRESILENVSDGVDFVYARYTSKCIGRDVAKGDLVFLKRTSHANPQESVDRVLENQDDTVAYPWRLPWLDWRQVGLRTIRLMSTACGLGLV